MAQQLEVRYVNYYCAGSSALKVAPAIPQKKLAIPRKKKVRNRVIHIDPVAYAGIAMAVLMTIFMFVGFAQLNAAQKEEIAMASYVETLRQENKELTATFEAGYDLAQVEEVALALGMVPANDLKKVIIEDVEPVQEPEQSKWNNFWTSIVDLFA